MEKVLFEDVDLEADDVEFLDIDEIMNTVLAKTTNADDAAVPKHLWNDRIAENLMLTWKRDMSNRKQVQNRIFVAHNPPVTFKKEKDRDKFKWAMRRIRSFCLRYWKKKVIRDFDKWFEEVGKLHEDSNQVFLDGQAACMRANGASWWECDKGSSIYFWRWHPDYQEAAIVGIAPIFYSDHPSNQSRQPPYNDDEVKAKMKPKLQKVIDKGYIELTELKLVEAMMFMFHVPKGEKDIRMVYDGSKSGLNEALYAPWFSLPTIGTMVRWVVAGAWLVDND